MTQVLEWIASPLLTLGSDWERLEGGADCFRWFCLSLNETRNETDGPSIEVRELSITLHSWSGQSTKLRMFRVAPILRHRADT
jgi:hypothetical protein